MRPIPHPDDGAFATATDGWAQCGLTKRELFAAMAMQGMTNNNNITVEIVAAWSVQYADALLAELAKEPE